MSDVSAHPGGPQNWIQTPAPRGGSWLVFARDKDVLVIAAPAVALRDIERPDDLRHWRIACWPVDDDGWLVPNAMSCDGDAVTASTSEVLALLPAAYQEWVEAVMRSQLEQCVAFVTSYSGRPPQATIGCLSTQRLVALRAELQAAFPDQDWYTTAPVAIPAVPDTDSALLAAIDEGRRTSDSPVCPNVDADDGSDCASSDYVSSFPPSARSYRSEPRPPVVVGPVQITFWLSVALAVCVAALLALGGFMVGEHDVQQQARSKDAVREKAPARPPRRWSVDEHDSGWSLAYAASGGVSQRPLTNTRTSEALPVGWADAATFAVSGMLRTWPSMDRGDLHAVYRDRDLVMVATRAAQQPLRGLLAGVDRVAFSPDGETLAAIAADGNLRLWDARGQRPLGAQLPNATSGLRTMAFHPDRKTLVTASDDGRLQLWDTRTRTPLARPLKVATRPVEAMAFSPDGRALAVLSGGTARIWRVVLRAPIGLPLDTSRPGQTRSSVPRWSSSAAFAAGLKRTNTRRQLARPEHNVNGSVTIMFSLDSRRLAIAADDSVQTWNLTTGKRTHARFKDHSGDVTAIAFSRGGRRLAIGADDGSLRLWDVSNGRRLQAPVNGHVGSVRSVTFSADGRRIASGGADKTVRVWDVGHQRLHGRALIGHTASVDSVAFTPDDRALASGSSDRTVRLWNVDQRQEDLTTSDSRAPTSDPRQASARIKRSLNRAIIAARAAAARRRSAYADTRESQWLQSSARAPTVADRLRPATVADRLRRTTVSALHP